MKHEFETSGGIVFCKHCGQITYDSKTTGYNNSLKLKALLPCVQTEQPRSVVEVTFDTADLSKQIDDQQL